MTPRTDTLENVTQHQLRSLAHRDPKPEVELCSCRAGVYLVHLHDEQKSYQLVDNHQQPIHFHAIEEAKDLLRPMGFTHGILTFIDDSDEMIGSEMARVSSEDALKNGTRIGF
ncbi:hypothetical protein GCM10007160_19750 [Litchfieldella qijiaojingensis]|uniref:Uncharacterized protein n=1 Tax=Litchfieldella qijiaojingensis TaxID=980347 RepID=A0ABQ2YSD6_9GAMM|nr:DUF6482 family protein [Halomonas qijiaojingensis]GGX92211.1 hypothetical protein GCM10007160_19750 [Halomonas qijiaojingensis]